MNSVYRSFAICSDTAKELLSSSRSQWKSLLQYTYEGENGDETTPFRELVRRMPGTSHRSNNVLGVLR